jgi:hypothetical protein
MNIEEIKALYAKRDEAYSALLSINHEIDAEIESKVQNLADIAMPIQSGNKRFWSNRRLRDLVTFDSDNNEFIIVIESYAGEGNWFPDCDENGYEDLECARVPARWLEMTLDSISSEILKNKAKKEADEQIKKDAIAEEKNKKQEAYELAELARLSSKYKGKETS